MYNEKVDGLTVAILIDQDYRVWRAFLVAKMLS